jgi:hypothetical protein
MHTGVYSGLNLINGKPIRAIVTAAPKKERNTWHWDKNTVDRLKKLCYEIEASPIMNPHGLTIPRGIDGVSWLWKKDH